MDSIRVTIELTHKVYDELREQHAKFYRPEWERAEFSTCLSFENWLAVQIAKWAGSDVHYGVQYG